mmetsp:Transcript_62912/g.183997  ORF Transcript_62912/g.183997 Transcript_62912/m.183997 type:complete len:243 (+) Transcript_62912:129-857(+)
MCHSLTASIELPQAIVEKKVEGELTRGDARCLELWRHTIVGQGLVLESCHVNAETPVASFEGDVFPLHSRDFKLNEADYLVLQPLLIHVRWRRLEGDVLRDELAELREDALRLHVDAVVLRDLQFESADGPVSYGIVLLIRLDSVGTSQLPHDSQGGPVQPPARGGLLEEDKFGQQRGKCVLQKRCDRVLPLADALQLVQELQEVGRVLGIELFPRWTMRLCKAYVVDPRLLLYSEDQAPEL